LRKLTANKRSKTNKKTQNKKSESKPSQKVIPKVSNLDVILKKAGPINFRAVHDAWEYMQEVGIEEFEYRSPKFEIKLRAGMGHVAPVPASKAQAGSASSGVSIQQAPALAAPAAGTAKNINVHVVTSPFVGTFYRSPGPNEDSFVEVGRVVRPGDVLCIVEAMKLMNEIESDASGKIVRILAENGTAVEFGEPLFEIEKL
jgi:acetyl-CoA carboxylase biotin carboxyl carrier protein